MEDATTSINSNKAEASGLNLKEFFFKYVRYLPFYAISVALTLFAAFGYLRYATEFYRSMGTIIIKDDKSATSGNGNDKIDVLMQQDSRKNIQLETEVLQSRPVMERVVKALNLNFTYSSVGKIKELDVYGLVPFKIESLHIKDSNASFQFEVHFTGQQKFRLNTSGAAITIAQPFTTPNGTFRLLKTKPQDVSKDYKIIWQPTSVRASNLLGGITVIPKQSTPILQVSMESTSPLLSADVVNQLLKEYQAVTLEDKNTITLQKLMFIDARLDSVSRQYDSINNLYVAFRQKENIISPTTQSENYLRRIEESSNSLSQQKLQVQSALQIEDYLRHNGGFIVPSSLTIQDETMASLVGGYNKAQQERVELLKNAPEGNVAVAQKTAETEDLRRRILEIIQNIKKSFGTTVSSLTSINSEALQQVGAVPTKERDWLNFQRDLQTKGEIYKTLLGRRDEAAITLAATISNTKILQDAQPNFAPIKPDRQGTKTLAIVIGLLIPSVIIILIELLNDKISSRHDIERLTQATILGEVGHNHSDETLLVTPGNRKVIAEQFRILRSNLQYFLTQVERPIIMVTSSFSGEGKSFISSNMGAVMALANKKTIILEFDIRKPKILSQLNLGKRLGLTNYLLGKIKAEDLPVAVEGHENLFVLPCGPVPPNPAELLLDPKLDELFVYLKQSFEVIVMDTAPVGMVSDALTLSKYANCTLYIVRQGHTFKKQIGLIDEYYREAKLPKLSVVLNDAKLRAGYGTYGYGGYGYGYGEGYFEDEEKKHGLRKWFSWFQSKNGVEAKSKKEKV